VAAVIIIIGDPYSKFSLVLVLEDGVLAVEVRLFGVIRSRKLLQIVALSHFFDVK